MKNLKYRSALVASAVTALAASSVVLTPPPAQAAETDISVSYTTAYYAGGTNYPNGGTNFTTAANQASAYTVYSEPKVARTDMQLVYKIEAGDVTYPIPVVNYVGDWDITDPSHSATYTFRFACTSGAECDQTHYLGYIAAMNQLAAEYDGQSIDKFTTQITPIINNYGWRVPTGITGTVTTSVSASTPGHGYLEFYLVRGDGTQDGSAASTAGLEHLSPTLTTPFEIRDAAVELPEARTLCAPGIENASNFGRENLTKETLAAIAKGDRMIRDATQEDVAAGTITYTINNAGGEAIHVGVTESALATTVLGLTAGEYTYTATYTPEASTGLTERVSEPQSIKVLGADDSRCTKTVDPVNPNPIIPIPIPIPVNPSNPATPVDPAKPASPASPNNPASPASTNKPAAKQLANTGVESTLSILGLATLTSLAGTVLIARRRKA